MTDVLVDYVARVRANFPNLEIQSARVNSDGMMNDVVVVNEEHIFRFAKNEYARALLSYEAEILDLIGRYVSTPVPRVEQCTDSYMHYRLVPGLPMYRHQLLRTDARTQDSLANALATFLQQLHGIPLSEIPTLPGQEKISGKGRQTFYKQRLMDLEQDVFPFLWADQKDWIADLYAPLMDRRVDLDAFSPVLIHRDLASYHILHDPEQGCLTGIIDFGTAGAGDAATDWACLINTYGEGFVRRMHRVCPIPQATIDRARFLASALELEWALNGVRSQDMSLLLVHLGRARDSRPMQTPWPI